MNRITVFSFFFAEARKANSEMYPPRTLKEIAAGMQHYLNYELRQAVSIFKDKEFAASRESLDAAMKKSASCGTVKEKKQAASVTEEKENQMWTNGCFGVSNFNLILI